MNDLSERRPDAWRARLLEAQLLAMSPGDTYRWYEAAAACSWKEPKYWGLDDALEQRLLDRNEALITLAVASFTPSVGTGKRVLQRVAADKASGRLVGDSPNVLALLAHPNLGNWTFDTPLVASPAWYHSVEPWFAGASPAERSALLANPSVQARWLSGLLNGEHGWALIAPEEQRTLVRVLVDTLKHRELPDKYDGWGHYEEHRLVDVCWRLAQRVPVDREWGHTLATICPQLPPDVIKRDVNEWLATAARWMTIEHPQVGGVDPYPYVRTEIGRLLLAEAEHGPEHEHLTARLLVSEDRALQLAACRYGTLSRTQVGSAFARDASEDTFNALASNLHVWRRLEEPSDLLAGLRDELCAALDADPARQLLEELGRPWQVWQYEEMLQKVHPQAFARAREEPEEPRPVPETDLAALALESRIEVLGKQVDEVAAAVKRQGYEIQSIVRAVVWALLVWALVYGFVQWLGHDSIRWMG